MSLKTEAKQTNYIETIKPFTEVKQGDCLDLLKEIPAESINLIYFDPPFFTQKIQRLKTRDRKKEFLFDDLWKCHNEYAQFLYERIVEMHRVLLPNGSIFFHCDKNASHIARIILDDIFGDSNFQSEIIWYYKRWSNSKKGLLPAHQNIFFYSKSEKFKFNPIYQDYSPSTNIDQILQNRKRDEHGKAIYAKDDDGIIISGGPKKGVPLADVWDIPYLNPKAKERVGYPTQKPLLLLERIINLCSDPGDIVLDPFCGSGTTLVAAKMLGRNTIGIDISEDAIKLTKQRLNKLVKSDSLLLQKGRESYLTQDKEVLDILSGLDCIPVQRNKGIDAFLKKNYKNRPVPIRIQRSHESLLETAGKLIWAAKSKHSEVMFLVQTHPSKQLSITSNIPKEVIVVNSTAYKIKRKIQEIISQNIQELTG